MNAKDLEAIIAKLQAHAERVPDFTPAEVQTVKEMLRAFTAWQSLGRAAKWVIVALGLLAGLITAATTISAAAKGALRSWLA